MPRLFTGVELPYDIKQRLSLLRQPLPGARWVEPDNFHVTLRFAGDIDNAIARDFAAMLASIDVESFELRLSGLGTFGGKDPRVLWAGVETGPQMDALARANERAARAAGLAPERQQFKPHVTIARFKHARSDMVARFLERNSGFRTPYFRAGSFVLISSKPKTGGGPYVIEDRFQLGGSAYGMDDVSDQDFAQDRSSRPSAFSSAPLRAR